MATLSPGTCNFIPPAGGSPTPARSLVHALEATGTDRFGATLLNLLQETCGADYCAVFQLGPDAPSELVTGSHDGSATAHARVSTYLQRQTWAKDPAMVYAQTRLPVHQTLLMRVDVSDIQDEDLREAVWPRIRDRVVIAGRSGRSAYSVSILREGRGRFTPDGIGRIAESAQVLISVLAKHADLSGAVLRRSAQCDVFRSLADTQACLTALTPLARREAEVCARILHGLSTRRIAQDLGVGAETVKTFRKLAYRRMGIGSERELLAWYLGLQARWRTSEAGA
ncbi:MAG: helix-turn-helix transcriptional regulator [Hydrogenophaga sp.]|uniref:helix-turn-helix transcriptional regulator n=1 Tax=Hydrogenophaga sp. TaxID=1904254 RepID=UPI003D144928